MFLESVVLRVERGGKDMNDFIPPMMKKELSFGRGRKMQTRKEDLVGLNPLRILCPFITTLKSVAEFITGLVMLTTLSIASLPQFLKPDNVGEPLPPTPQFFSTSSCIRQYSSHLGS